MTVKIWSIIELKVLFLYLMIKEIKKIIMNLSLKTITTTLAFWLLLCNFNAHCQTFSIDTDEFFDSDEEIIGPKFYQYYKESEIVANGIVPTDMIFVPTSILYKNRWDTLNIRTGRIDWSKISDSTVLFIHNLKDNGFVFPHKGKVISPYGYRGGRMHTGMDIKLNRGDTVVSAFNGKVRISRTIGGYGKIVVIRHNNGIETVYAHLSASLVHVNQEVIAGQPIGFGGRTGRATTDHLHFETRILGEPFNPAKIIDFDHFCIKGDKVTMDKQLLGFGTKPASMVTDTPKESEGKYVKIHSGDTLYALALKHKTTVDRICKINGITTKKVLKIGTVLCIE